MVCPSGPQIGTSDSSFSPFSFLSIFFHSCSAHFLQLGLHFLSFVFSNFLCLCPSCFAPLSAFPFLSFPFFAFHSWLPGGEAQLRKAVAGLRHGRPRRRSRASRKKAQKQRLILSEVYATYICVACICVKYYMLSLAVHLGYIRCPYIPRP